MEEHGTVGLCAVLCIRLDLTSRKKRFRRVSRAPTLDPKCILAAQRVADRPCNIPVRKYVKNNNNNNCGVIILFASMNCLENVVIDPRQVSVLNAMNHVTMR